MTAESQSQSNNQFGTLGGVFTPSILTILGAIMFMLATFVVGQAGIVSAILILLVAKSITFLTGLSISAISTNGRVKGGGAYFLISRSLGPESGGAVGLTLYLAQAFSVPFYILAFIKALVASYPTLKSHFLTLTLATALILFIVNLFGAGWALRVQYVILAVLVLAIFAFMGGALQLFSWETLQANLSSGYTALQSNVPAGEVAPTHNFWSIFAIYFPAVTGIMAGVNMSGDLKDPSKSIPRGTLLAIGVGFAVYFAQIIVCGGAFNRAEMIANPYGILVKNALFGMGVLVFAGAAAATLSSALGSLMGAPRILQALSRDNIFRSLSFFAKGSAKGDEPIRGLWLTFGLTLAVLLFAGNDAEGGALGIVAGSLTMFFLFAYGLTNVAAAVESLAKNPSFRPRFRFFHWSTALLGALGCFAAALLIDWIAALAAMLVIAIIFYLVRRRILSTAFGDARRGFYYSRARENLFNLASQPPHPKNWRPTTLVLTGNPHTRLTLAQYAIWLESGRGIVTLAQIIRSPIDDEALRQREEALQKLDEFIKGNGLSAFPEVLITPDFDDGMACMLQTHAIGPLKPNMVMMGWPTDPNRIKPFVKNVHLADALSISQVLTIDRGLPEPGVNRKQPRRIDVWWRGMSNGSLMLILAHLLLLNRDWRRAELRILRHLQDKAQYDDALAELQELVEAARLDASIQLVVSDADFPDILHLHSQDATLVMLGFSPPNADRAEAFQAHFTELLDGLPTTLLVCSSGEADLLA